MKYLIFISISFLFTVDVCAQEKDFDAHQWKPPYFLELPKGWGSEKFTVPPGFAPEIKYHGVEDIRFAPGWGNAGNENYWTYAFLWFLDEPLTLTTESLEKDLTAYYTGLLKVNSDSTKHGGEKTLIVKTSMKNVKALAAGEPQYEGTIYMRDYMSRKPITLNCRVISRFCKETNKAIVFFRLSPQPFSHAAWKLLDDLWLNFRCTQ